MEPDDRALAVGVARHFEERLAQTRGRARRMVIERHLARIREEAARTDAAVVDLAFERWRRAVEQARAALES